MISWYMDSSCTVFLCSLAPSRPASYRPEELPYPDYSVGERVDLFVGVVQVKACPGGGLDAERPMQRPGAVVPGAHRHAPIVEHLADVMRVHAIQDERDRAAPVPRLGGPDDSQAVDLPEGVQGAGEQHLLVRPDRVEPDLGEVIHRGGQSDRLGDWHRARLELVRRGRERGMVDPDAFDHLAAAEEGRHVL